MSTTSLADAKNRLLEIVAAAERTHERTILTKNSRPTAVILSMGDFESLLETISILSDTELADSLLEPLDTDNTTTPGEVLAELRSKAGSAQ